MSATGANERALDLRDCSARRESVPLASRQRRIAANRMSATGANERAERASECRGRESNPHAAFATQDFKSCASASFATPASEGRILERAAGL
jgi:hypothetical protein